MKKCLTIALSACLAIITITGCSKVIDKIFDGFEADVPAFQVTMPAIIYAPPMEIPLGSFTQNFNLDSLIKANTSGTFGADDVRSVKVKTIQFTLLNADESNNVSNFQSARFTVNSNSNSTPVQLASVTFPNEYATSFTYTATESAPELKTYLTGNQLTYNFYGQARKVTTKPLQLKINVTLNVK